MVRIEVIPTTMVNIFVLIGKKPILVDTGMENQEDKVLKGLEKLHIKPTDIDLIIITHGHVDHYGGVKKLAAICDAKVMIHELENPNMIDGTNGVLIPTGKLSRMINWQTSKRELSLTRTTYQGDIIISEDLSLIDYQVDAEVIMTPGHTKGSISIVTPNKEAIIGDLLMAMIPGSKPTKPLYACDLNVLRKSLRKLIDLGAESFYLSHGKVYSRIDIEKAMKQLVMK